MKDMSPSLYRYLRLAMSIKSKRDGDSLKVALSGGKKKTKNKKTNKQKKTLQISPD
jgi:hypothetical protein